MTVVGARPQFVKAAMLSRALRDAGLRELLVHTGQHYDEAMSGAFFRDLGLPDPAMQLLPSCCQVGPSCAGLVEPREAMRPW